MSINIISVIFSLLCYNFNMLDLRIIAAGHLKDRNLQAAAAEYIKRLRPYARLEVLEFAAASFSQSNQEKAKKLEAERIRQLLARRPGPVFLLAEKGKSLDSLSWAEFIGKNQPLTLVIAGALGFSQELYREYPSLSLSPLTFPHELARLVLLEQLYRAATILTKKNYHY